MAYGVDYECRLQSNKTEIPALIGPYNLKVSLRKLLVYLVTIVAC